MFCCRLLGNIKPPNMHYSAYFNAGIHSHAVTVPGKLLSGEEEGLEDDPEKAEVTTGSFTGINYTLKVHFEYLVTFIMTKTLGVFFVFL